MKIAIVGYGKMGKIIEQKALLRGHSVGLKIDSSNLSDFNQQNFEDIDLAIEFTGPDHAYNNLEKLINWGIPTVSGSTGWLEKFEILKSKIKSQKGSFFYASNFSIAVNIFFELNKKLSSLTSGESDYNIKIEEIHHLEKLDSPSGTAITLAEQIIAINERKEKWENENSQEQKSVSIISKREPDVHGTHIVSYVSPFDEIEIKHTAKSRDGFAQGAIHAAEWLLGKNGIFGMEDMLSL